jgi:Ca2+-binding RTX toxin-like protein
MATIDGTSGDDTLSGTSGDDTINGFDGNDAIDGGAGNDTLDGGAGADIIYGGLGDDSYIVDDAGDIASEFGGGGVDEVWASVTYALRPAIERLTLTGSSAIGGTGNSADNAISGNEAANSLDGAAGNDTLFGNGGGDNLFGGSGNDILDGGAGFDAMAGGLGNDTYYIDDTAYDTVTEQAGEGTDMIVSAIDRHLDDNVENLTLTGSAIVGTGNGLNNVIIGNGGSNALNGYGGIDTLIGGAGDDTYTIDSSDDVVTENAGEGIDTVRAFFLNYTLSDNVENLELHDSGPINGAGNALDNRITGNAARNVLDGGAGADDLIGFGDDDTYVVDNYDDNVIENVFEGTDSVLSSASYRLADNVENLTLTGSAVLWGYGNELWNALTGNAEANKLFGLGGYDVLDGGAGADKMFGGTGGDTYFADTYNDHVVEQVGEGTDRVFASANFALGANVENLLLTGGADLWAYGNALDNTLSGNSGANKLYGLAGNDTLVAGSGNDWLEGGAGQDRLFGESGADTFVFRDGDFAGLTTSTCDQIKDFTEGTGDKIRLNAVDANTGLAGDQAFAFIGSAAFTNTAGELRYEQVSGNTYVSGDTNGDGVADFMIRLDGLHTLVGTDFGL